MKVLIGTGRIIAALTCIAIAACRPALYIPNVQNVPAFTQSGEVQATGFLGLDHIEAQVAYAPYNSIGVMGNYYKGINANFYECAAGYWMPFNNMKGEMFAGYGFGKVAYTKSRGGPSTGQQKVTTIDGRYHRYFVQQDIAWIKRNSTIAFNMRWNYLIYDKYYHSIQEYSYYSPTVYYSTGFEELSDDGKRALILEPGVTVKTGGQHIKFFLQTGIICPLNAADRFSFSYTGNYLIGSPVFLNTGIQLSAVLKKKRKKQEKE